MAIGAIQAMKAAGHGHEAMVMSAASTPRRTRCGDAAGDLDVTVFQDAAGQGQGAVDAALKLAKGEAVEQKVYIPFQLVTPANIERLPGEELSLTRGSPGRRRAPARNPQRDGRDRRRAVARGDQAMAQTTHGVDGLTVASREAPPAPELNVLIGLVVIAAVFEALGWLIIGDSFLFNTATTSMRSSTRRGCRS